MMMTGTRALQRGQKLRLFPGEYPCVRRLRSRRLLTFLWLQGYGSTFVAMLKQTDSYFCVFHLVHLVSQGQWTQALDYIFPRFLPKEPCWTPSLEASVLVKFLRVHQLFETVCCKFSRDWRAMWAKAAEIVGDLANRTPEFKDRLLLPDGLMGPQNVLPIGFGFAPLRPRQHIRKRTRPTSKRAREDHNRRIAYIYAEKRMSVPSSSHCSQELSPEILAKQRDDWFQRIFAATRLELNRGCVLRSSAREGASVTGNSQPQIGGCPGPKTQSPVRNRQPSKMMTRTRLVVCGQELQLYVPGEYPCEAVPLLAAPHLPQALGYDSTFVAMTKQTNYFFCVFHLARLVSQGLWTEALDYIFPRFLPLEPCSPPSLEASVLVKFLRVHRLFQLEVASKISQDWRPMWARAAKIVRDLAIRTPEFKDRLLLPDGLMGPQNILPIGFSFAPLQRRRHVKKCTHPTSKHAREHACRIANIYFEKMMSLSSSSHRSQELSPEIMAKARDDWFRRIFEQCIKAATCPEINQGCALQSSAWEGTPITGNVINSKLSSIPLTTDADNFGNVIDPKKSFISSVNGTGSPVWYAMFGDVINSAVNSGISSVSKTGSAISQTLLGTMACPAKISEVISTINAGTSQEICFSESAREGSHPRNRPMREQIEDYLATKKQHTTGANDEASTDLEVRFTGTVCEGSHSRKRPRAELTGSATKRQLTAVNKAQR